MAENPDVSLTTLRNGTAVEQFDAELRVVLENILDPNTDPKAVREITLKVTIKPSEDRSMGAVFIHCHSKVAAQKSQVSTLFFGRGRNGVEVFEHNPAQPSLDFEGEGNVVGMKKKENGSDA